MAILAGVVVAAALARPSAAAPGLRVWNGHGEVVHAGKTIAKVSSVGLLEFPNGRFAFTTMTRPVVYAFSGYGPPDHVYLEDHYHVDSFAAQATPDSPAVKADDECVVVHQLHKRAIYGIDCSADPNGTFFLFTADGHGPTLRRSFKPDAPVSGQDGRTK